MQEKIIKELRQELKAQTDENQELLKINEEHQKINGELRKEIDGLVTVIDLAKNYIKHPIFMGDEKKPEDILLDILEILERVNESEVK